MNNQKSTKKSDKFTDKKRKRSFFTEKEISKSEKPSKKFHSEETKKINELNIKEIDCFLAKINPQYENTIFPEEEKLTGEKLIFDNRKKEAEKIFKNIKEDNDELNQILGGLKYDNTNKMGIYKLLNYYYKINEQNNFEEALNKFKFCLTQKFTIKENGEEKLIDLNNMFKIKISVDELEELPNHKKNDGNNIIDLRNSLIEFFTSYYYISKCIEKYKHILNKEELKKILSVKYIKSSEDSSYKFVYEKNEKLNLLYNKDKEKQKNKKVEDNIIDGDTKDQNNKKNKSLNQDEKGKEEERNEKKNKEKENEEEEDEKDEDGEEKGEDDNEENEEEEEEGKAEKGKDDEEGEEEIEEKEEEEEEIKEEEGIEENEEEGEGNEIEGNEEESNQKEGKEEERNEEDERNEQKTKDEEVEEEVSEELLLKSIENFLSKYIFYQEFKSFQMNQPVNYRNNLSLYYNYIIWSLYEITIEVKEKEQKIIFVEQKIFHYRKLKHIHNLLFDKYFDKEEPFQEIMDQLLQYLMISLSKERDGHLDSFYKFIHLNKIEKFIDEDSSELFKRKLNKNYKFLNAKFEKGKRVQIVFEEKEKIKCKKIRINYKNYTKNGLLSVLPENIDWLWKKINFANFQETNFFLKEDLEYLKYLIGHILSSNLFKNIFDHFNDVKLKADFYFGNSKNREDYINRIIFLPFSTNDLEKFALTDRRTLSVLVAGYPEKSIYNLDEYRIYRLLELSLRAIVLGHHEPCHFIKAAYSLLTENIISRNTSNDNKDIESGFFFEEILFGWVKKRKKPFNLVKMGLLKKEIKCQNNAIKNKKIDLITALTLLNPEIYDYDLDYFRQTIFNLSPKKLKTFSFSSINNQRYRLYLQSLFDIKKIKNYKNNTCKINVAMGCGNIICVEYTRYNHNLYRKIW